MAEFVRDLRIGVRQLIHRPGFTLAAVASLALGIGLNTTLFSVVNAVLLRETPVAAPDRLVEIYSDFSEDFPQLTTSYPDFLDLREATPALEALTAHAFVRGILAAGDRPTLVTGEAVSANYFDVLGIAPARGRGFRLDEDRVAGTAPVVVLSHGVWQRVFGGRPDVVGEAVRFSGHEYNVVGVAPATFRGTIPGISTDFWVPVTMVERFEFSGVQANTDNDPGLTRLEQRGSRWLFVKGRLADGRSADEAASQVEAVFTRLRADYPLTNEDVASSVVPSSSFRFHPMLDGYVQAASAVLLIAVGLVLLVACANVANMLLARGSARRREVAIRAAIGAGRARIIRHLVTEAVLLAVAGGAVGTVLALWATRLLSNFGTSLPMNIDFDVSIDGTVLLFTVGVSLLTATVAGIVPAWFSSKLDLVTALKESLTGDTGRARRRVTLRDSLVVAQLALSLVLLVAGALLTRGLLTARSTDIGFDPAHIATLSFNLRMNGYDLDRAAAFRARAVEDLSALPGVEAVSFTSRLPLAPDISMEGIKVTGHHSPDDDAEVVDRVQIGADYFTVVGVPILAGRAFTADDVRENRRVAIVNETMARQYWPGETAVGRLIYPGDFDEPPLEVVGVARDHKVRSVGEDPRAYLHTPGDTSASIGLIVRTMTEAEAALPMLRQALWRLEPAIVFTGEGSAAEMAAATMAPTIIGAGLMAAFGALALVLAAVGLYGVVAYSVTLRTREIGIRMALGAAYGQVLRLMFIEGARIAGAGVVLGVLASLGVGQVLASLLYGVSGFDPIAFGVAAGVLMLAASLANLVPALAAARIDPLAALRQD